MASENIVKLVISLDDGTFIVEHADGRLERQRSQTDWARLRAMTDEEIEANARSDPDWEGLLDLDWSKAEVVRPTGKILISIRLDSDILGFFKAEGPGYQGRINAVLRSYVTESRKASSQKAPTKKAG